MAPELVLHVVPPSHPCMTATVALRLKGLEYERVEFVPGEHVEQMRAIYGEGNHTVPGLLVDGEPVHGSRAILARLEQLAPDPPLYPSADVREAERWGDQELQDLGRRLPWGALHFRPEAMGTFGGAGPLDGPGTDFAIRFVRSTWKYHGISAARLQEDLAGLSAKLAHVEELAAAGVIGGEQPNAADLQIGATLRVLLTLGDLRPLLSAGVGERIAMRNFPDTPETCPLARSQPAGCRRLKHKQRGVRRAVMAGAWASTVDGWCRYWLGGRRFERVVRMRCVVRWGVLAVAALASTAAFPSVANARTGAHRALRRAHTAVVGGQSAEPGTFPWMAYVLDVRGDDVEQCSGTVVAPNLVLTAGHCTENMQTGVPTSSPATRW